VLPEKRGIVQGGVGPLGAGARLPSAYAFAASAIRAICDRPIWCSINIMLTGPPAIGKDWRSLGKRWSSSLPWCCASENLRRKSTVCCRTSAGTVLPASMAFAVFSVASSTPRIAYVRSNTVQPSVRAAFEEENCGAL